MSVSNRRPTLSLDRLDDRLTPAGVHAAYAVTQNWGGGFQAEVRLTNDDATAVPFSTLKFDLPAAVTSIWDAKVVSHVGTQYTVTNNGWNAVVPARGSVSFGFVASPGSAGAAGGFVLNGVPLDGPTQPPTVPPTQPPTVPPSAPSAVTFAVGSDWGSGQTGTVTVRNTGTTPVSGWSLAFDFAAGIPSIWDAQITAHVGTRYTVKPQSYNAAIPAGGSVTFGFNADRGGLSPTNFALTTTTTTVPPVVPPTIPPTIPPTVPPSVPPTVPPVAASAWPASTFAPYVDTGLYPTYTLANATRQAGVKYFTLAFVTAGTQNQPAWGGFDSYGLGSEFDQGLKTQVNALRQAGGDVAVSFGGANGRELGEVVTNVTNLAAAYRSVIQAYGLTHVDFDIEGGALANRAANDRRNAAITVLQQEAAAAGRELNVRYTLPVLPTGLTNDGLALLQSARAAGVRVDVVNVMAMDYGDGAAPNPAGRMGDYAIQAATSLFGQLTTLYGPGLSDAAKWKMIGVTPMIGLNDVTTETFDQQEARELEAWAQSRGIGLLAMWSLNRDYQNPRGAIGYVDLTSSSLVQSPLEFSQIFNPFTR